MKSRNKPFFSEVLWSPLLWMVAVANAIPAQAQSLFWDGTDTTANADGNVTINSGGTLAGSGTVGGNTMGLAGAFLNPGNSPGTLNFMGNLSLAGTTNIEIAGIGTGQFDVLKGDGGDTLTLGGVLALNNTGYFGSATLGDSITIFSNWANFSGSFTSITGTDLGSGLMWDTSSLATNGSLTVIATAVPEPATAVFLAGGTVLFAIYRRRRNRREVRSALNETQATMLG